MKATLSMRKSVLCTLLAAVLAASALAPLAVQAQETQITVTAASYGATRNVKLNLNKSMIVDLPAGVSEVVVSQPSVAAAIMRTRTRAIVQGIQGGDTNIFFLDDAGRTITVLNIEVVKEPSQVGIALEAALARVIPGSRISVESVDLNGVNRVVLTGSVLSGDDRDRAVAVASQFAGDPTNVAEILDIAGTQQVMLQVTVSEIRREVAQQLGINLSGTVTLGNVNLGFNSGVNTALGAGNAATGSFPIGNVQLDAAIKALETRGAIHVLAQPTLTAMSGEMADFLAGGELPYASVDANGNPTTLFKPYGVELEFTPVVKSNGMIGLKVNTSVSEPRADASINKRQAQTTVELPAGHTLAIGGLLDQRTTQNLNQLPGIGNIPILGALFRSRAYQSFETELVILVTPYLVGSSPAGGIPVPTDYSQPATDAEAIFLGKMESNYGVTNGGGMRGGFSGSVGFVLD